MLSSGSPIRKDDLLMSRIMEGFRWSRTKQKLHRPGSWRVFDGCRRYQPFLLLQQQQQLGLWCSRLSLLSNTCNHYFAVFCKVFNPQTSDIRIWERRWIRLWRCWVQLAAQSVKSVCSFGRFSDRQVRSIGQGFREAVPNFPCLPSYSSLPEISTFASILASDRWISANGTSLYFSVHHTDLKMCIACYFNRLAAAHLPHVFTPWTGRHLRRNRRPWREASSCMRLLSSICIHIKTVPASTARWICTRHSLCLSCLQHQDAVSTSLSCDSFECHHCWCLADMVCWAGIHKTSSKECL